MDEDKIIYSINFSVFNISEFDILNKRIKIKRIRKTKYFISKKVIIKSLIDFFQIINISENKVRNK